jgi:hypothetical protein
MLDTSVWRVSNLLGACGIVFPAGVDTDSPYFDLLCKSAIGRTSYWRAEEKTLESGQVVNEIKDYAEDESQEPIEVKNEDDDAPWVEE